jgi:hypothetical protein
VKVQGELVTHRLSAREGLVDFTGWPNLSDADGSAQRGLCAGVLDEDSVGAINHPRRTHRRVPI